MTPIKSMSVLFIVLLVGGFAYAATDQPERSATLEEYLTPKILCLNHTVSSEIVDVSMTPVYDWVHAGEQGIRFTITNKTEEDLLIDWDRNLSLSLTGEGTFQGEGADAVKPGSNRLFEVVAPGVTFSRTLWPRSNDPEQWRPENRTVFLTARTYEGAEKYQEIMLDVSGEQRVCSR